MWTCTNCGTNNTAGDVCYRCGERRPRREAESFSSERMPAGLFLLSLDKYQRWQHLTGKDLGISIESRWGYAVLLLAVFMAGIMPGLICVLSVIPLGDTPARDYLIAYGLGMVLLYFLSLFVASLLYIQRMQPMYSSTPASRIYGELIQAQFRTNKHGRPLPFLQVDYRFQSPTTGQIITVREISARTYTQQWHGSPTPGNQVAIAYWDDKHTRIL